VPAEYGPVSIPLTRVRPALVTLVVAQSSPQCGLGSLSQRMRTYPDETSGMPMHTKIKEAYERVGADRVMFGTDMPFHHPSVEIQRNMVSGLSSEQLEDLFYNNVRKLLGLQVGVTDSQKADVGVGRRQTRGNDTAESGTRKAASSTRRIRRADPSERVG